MKLSLYFLKLCWKNIWRSRRRTLITVSAIGIGVAAMVFIHNFYDSFHDQLIANVIRYQSGHLMVTAPDYQKNQSPHLFVKNIKPVTDWLQNREEVQSASERVFVHGLLSSPQGSSNIVFMGINPDREKDVTKFASNMTRGEYFKADSQKAIVIGKTLAELLKVEVGSKVVALSQGIDGSIGNELFHVEGIFDTQSDADKNLAFIRLEDARALSSLPPSSAHQVTVLLKKDEDIDKMKAAYEARFPSPSQEIEGSSQVLSWRQVQKHILAMIELDGAVNRLLMMIILFVAALGIANSILMNIMERTREFGVMMAIGTSKSEVIGMVVVETVLLSVVGVILGNLLGWGVTIYFHQIGFDLKWLTSQNLVIDGAIVHTVSYPTIKWLNSMMVTTVILLLALLVSIIPSRHISKLSPVKALRSL